MISSFSVCFADSVYPYSLSYESTKCFSNNSRYLYLRNGNITIPTFVSAYTSTNLVLVFAWDSTYGASCEHIFYNNTTDSNYTGDGISLSIMGVSSTLYNNIYYCILEVASNFNTNNYFNIPVFDNQTSALDCVSLLSDGSLPPAKSYYTLQNGWLSVIDLGSSGANYEFDLNTTFQMNSGLVSGTWGNGTTQRYWFSSTLPDEDTSYLSTFGNAIDWEKGYPRTVFGQTKNATCTISGTSGGRYLYILNPALQQVADETSPSINNQSMTISGLTNGMSAKIYKLTATATINGIDNYVDINTVGTVSATDTASDLTNGFSNSDNENVVQNSGGGNENEVAQTVNGYLQGIQNALDNFVNQFISLLSAPISHIQQMIESGSNFFSVFGQLFTWLPQEISVIITGSLLLMVIIGVFKMFL